MKNSIPLFNLRFLFAFLLIHCTPMHALDHLGQPIQAIIFDCDGVLVDTESLKFLAWQKALDQFGIPFTVEEYYPVVGHSFHNIHKMLEKAKGFKIPSEVIQGVDAQYKQLQRTEKIPPIQPMVDFARNLFENKQKLEIKLALASSACTQEILINLKAINLEHVFDFIISGTDDLSAYLDPEGKNKPKPYIYLEAAKQLNISPELCLVFEDTSAGVNAAASAGMHAIAIPNAFTLNQDFSNASQIFVSHDELRSFEVKQTHYSFVLTPPADRTTQYVEMAQDLYKDCQPSYLLTNDGTSSPHITVVQFDCDSFIEAELVWQNMCAEMERLNLGSFVPPFIGKAFINGEGPYKGTTWVELSVKRGEETSPIMQIHQTAVNVLKHFNIKPLNATGNNYRPHLTLARVVMPQIIKAWPHELCQNPGKFKLEFGLSDTKWQYIQTLGTYAK